MKFEEEFKELYGTDFIECSSVDKITTWATDEKKTMIVTTKDKLLKHCVSKKFAVDIRTLNDMPLNQRPIPPDLKIRTIFGWTIADIAKMIEWYKENAYDGLIMEIGRLRETTIPKSKVREAIEGIHIPMKMPVKWLLQIQAELKQVLNLEEK